ncbi:MAG: hypothetical protein JWO89_3265, partial [Verrucomicrobiaceae bacterium]|nr:hypothetical protein [Verrucomicrobiaceae bacterium]
ELKTKFRPSDVCVGPDGAIYVADWFDPGVGGHGTRDDAYTGSIYRIAPKGFKSKVPKLDLTTIEGQIAALKSPAVNVRNSGFTRLKEQGDKAVPAVAALLADENPYVAARAAWLLAQMGPSGIAKVTPWLESKDANQRLLAYRALRRASGISRVVPKSQVPAGNRPKLKAGTYSIYLETSELDVVGMATKMAQDESAAVRREVALTMRDVPADKSVSVLVTLAKQFDGKDRAYLEALGLGSTGKEAEVYAAIAKEMGGPADSWSDAFAWIAWRLHPAAAVADFKARVLSSKLSPEQRKLMLTALAFVPTRAAAGAMIAVANTKDFPMHDLAQWWLLNRKGNDWRNFDVEAGMKALGLYDPEKVKLVAVEMPAMPEGAPKLPSVAEILKLKGDAKRGQVSVAVCYTCHRIGTNGAEFGPDLTAFGKQQGAEIITQAIAEPSASISHGFDGSEIKTKDGLTITGMILSNDDPVIIKCMGGMIQTAPKSRIQSVTAMTKSLMYQPQQLGLNGQTIADIVAYLKSL